MEILLCIAVIASAVALVILVAKRKDVAPPKTIKAPDPVKPMPPAPTVKKLPEPDPAQQPIVLFSDTLVRRVTRCAGCDGENPTGTQVCRICGKRM